MERKSTKKKSLIVAAAVAFGLLASVLFIYGQTYRFEFINWDDDHYLYANAEIQKGLTWENVYRAFASTQNHLWHPIATLSHLIDIELYGLDAGGHHLTNIAIHAAASLLLFVAFKRLTHTVWESGMVAGLFALHPLRVESVAWVTERKDLLTGFFLALVLLLYAGYNQRPSLLRYLGWNVAFVLGALSKPSFVAVPLILLLLDNWPLGRSRMNSASHPHRLIGLIIEKIPVLLISLVTCIVTVVVQSETAIVGLDQFSLSERLLNVGRSYAVYLAQFVWPTNLVPFYPFPSGNALGWQGAVGWLLVIAVSGMAVRLRCRFPFLFVGWFWYLVMLLPMIGIVQAGLQGHADRFTYLPQIGVAVIVVFGFREWLPRRSLPDWLPLAGGIALLTILSIVSWRQTARWRDGVNLFSYAIEARPPNGITLNLLGVAYHRAGRLSEAIAMFRRAVEIEPNYYWGIANLGNTLSIVGQVKEAVPILERAARLNPRDLDVANNLASSLLDLGRLDEAIARLEELKKIGPLSSHAATNLGLARLRRGQIDDAIAEFQSAVRLDASLADAWLHLASALTVKGSPSEAIDAYRSAIRLRPDHVEALRNAAWLVANTGDLPETTVHESLEWAKYSIALDPTTFPNPQIILAACYAANHQFDAAIAQAQQVEQWAEQNKNADVATAIRVHLELYRQGRSLR